jgi:hypothetical protein
MRIRVDPHSPKKLNTDPPKVNADPLRRTRAKFAVLFNSIQLFICSHTGTNKQA